MERNERDERDRNDGAWIRLAAKLFCIGVALIAGWLVFHYALLPLFVVLIAWGIAAVIHPLAKKTRQKTKIPTKLCAFVYLSVLLALLVWATYYVGNRLLREMEELLVWLRENGAEWEDRLGQMLGKVNGMLSGLPLIGDRGEGLGGGAMLSGLLERVTASLGEWLASLVGRILSATPMALLSLVVTVIACYYLSMDYERIRDGLVSLLPERVGKRVGWLRGRIKHAIAGYLRAYLLLMLLTFFLVFIGLLILGQNYAFLLAAVVAIVDLLPILGAGTVLVPWAILLFLMGRSSTGIGILILYGVLTVVRQIAEPRLLGDSLGVHPLVSLLFLFVGVYLFGVAGIVIGPVAALVAKELLLRKET